MPTAQCAGGQWVRTWRGDGCHPRGQHWQGSSVCSAESTFLPLSQAHASRGMLGSGVLEQEGASRGARAGLSRRLLKHRAWMRGRVAQASPAGPQVDGPCSGPWLRSHQPGPLCSQTCGAQSERDQGPPAPGSEPRLLRAPAAARADWNHLGPRCSAFARASFHSSMSTKSARNTNTPQQTASHPSSPPFT